MGGKSMMRSCSLMPNVSAAREAIECMKVVR